MSNTRIDLLVNEKALGGVPRRTGILHGLAHEKLRDDSCAKQQRDSAMNSSAEIVHRFQIMSRRESHYDGFTHRYFK